MRKNSSESKSQHSLRVREKNRLLFYRKLRSDKMFFARLQILLEDYGGVKDDVLLWSFINPIEIYKPDSFRNQAILIGKAVKTISKWEHHKKNLRFFDDVESFLKKFNLGFEWKIPLIALILEHRICLPFHNFSIGTNNDKRVVLTLNPDTSLDDLKYEFDYIKKRQKELQPNFKPINLTKDAFKRFYEVEFYDLAKIMEADIANRKQLTGYEERLYNEGVRQHSVKEAVKKINKPSYVAPFRKPRFQPRSRASDKAVAKRLASLTPKKSSLRILNNVRQQRKRQKA